MLSYLSLKKEYPTNCKQKDLNHHSIMVLLSNILINHHEPFHGTAPQKQHYTQTKIPGGQIGRFYVTFPKYRSCKNYLPENKEYTLKTLIFGRNVALHILIINQAICFVQIQVDMEKEILKQCRNISSNK